MAPKLRLVGKGDPDEPRDYTGLTYLAAFIVIVIILAVLTYFEPDTPMGTSKTFVKALMNGDSETIGDLNYTKTSTKELKTKWAAKLEDYKFSDLVFTQSDDIDSMVHVITKDGKVKMTINTGITDKHRYVKYLSP